MPVDWNTLARGAWKRWSAVLACLLLLGVLVLCASSETHRNMRYDYPVTVEVPVDVEVASVAYYCMFDRAQADFIIDDLDAYASSFEPTAGLRFSAQVQGYRTTSWCGLFEDAGRDLVLMVLVETTSGERFLGIADIPEERAEVVIAVKEFP